MATMTAQILVGNAHPNHGGINPDSSLFLSENSRPAWIMQHIRMADNRRVNAKTVWIPTIENMLEDAFLMIGIHLVQNAPLLALASSFFADIQAARVDDMYSHFSQEQRAQLYALNKCTELPKLIISVFSESHLANQLEVIEQYSMQVEVCTPKFTRTWNRWINNMVTSGAL